MTLRRMFISTLLTGWVAGLVFSLIQSLTITPIILEAETFEALLPHDHASHHHSATSPGVAGEQAWAPAQGVERAGFSILANIIAGMGYAALLLALMTQSQQQGFTQVDTKKGALWALGGFIAFFVAPGLGLPPEIPGIEAQPVQHRQAWWVMCVCCAGAGLLVLALAPLKGKLIGLAMLALPYIVSVPHSGGPNFVYPDAQTVLALTDLHRQFIVASALGNLIFWLVVGLSSAWLLNAWVLKRPGSQSSNYCSGGSGGQEDDGAFGA